MQSACDQILADGDHRRLRKAWPEVFPHLPGPKTDADAEIVMHHARTQNSRIAFKLRAYSHSWLIDHCLPSGLPDDLRPKAQRMYPVTVSAVGIAVTASNPLMQPVADQVRKAMESAVLEADADRKLDDSEFVRGRMQEARERTLKQLMGVGHGR